MPLTGTSADTGRGMKDGIEFVVEQIKAGGGIKSMGGTQITLVVGDDAGVATTGLGEMERLVTREKVSFVLGPYLTAVSTQTAPVSEKNKVPSMSIRTTGDPIYPLNLTYWRTLAVPSYEYGQTFTAHFKSLVDEFNIKADRIALIGEDIAVLKPIMQGAKDDLGKLGWGGRVVSEVFYDIRAPDLTPQATAIKGTNPDVAFHIATFSPGIVMARAMDAVRFYPRTLLGVDTIWGSPKAITALGQELYDRVMQRPGVFFPAYFDERAGVKMKSIQDFVARSASYRQAKGYKVTETDFAMGAQAMYILWKALEETGSAEPEKLNTWFRQAKLKEGDPLFIIPAFAPEITWQPNGKPVNARFLLSQWQKDRTEIIYPKSIRSFEPWLP